LLSSPTLSYIGRGEQAVRHAEQALRLSPLDRSLFYYYALLGLAYYANGNYVEAVKWTSMGANESPRHTANLRYLAAGLAALGRVEEAREAGRKFLELDPTFRLSTFERTLQPFQVPTLKEKHIEHLSKAGLPN
jgi:adenylate cyclase